MSADDLAAEIESWLADDVVGSVQQIVDAAQLSPRRRRDSPSRELSIPRPGERYVRSKPVGYCTPDDLRMVASEHDRVAASLRDDAAELREWADALEQPTGLGSRVAEHLEVMRDGVEQRQAANDRSYEIARDDGGVLKWAEVTTHIQWILWGAGLLTVEQVRAAVDDGSIWRVDGIGPSRYREIVRALRLEAEAR